MKYLKKTGNHKGFTFLELLVTIALITILTAGIVVIGKPLISSSKQTKCESNLQRIAVGLQMYHTEHHSFPLDGYPYDASDSNPLSVELADYVNSKSAFICPEDTDETSVSNSASYDPYYVRRIDSYDDKELVIGCPRHRGAESSASLFASDITRRTDIGTVQVNGQEVSPDGTTAQRTMSNLSDVMTFADGSTVTITNSMADYGVFLVQSVQLADGTLYSVIRVEEEGKIDIQVTPGSLFEIVTPSAIVGVRGTQFTVETTYGGYTTNVVLIDGTVTVTNRETGKKTTLTVGGTTSVEIEIENEDQELIAMINDSSISTGDLKATLIDESPLSENVLNELINADGGKRLSTGDYKTVLIENSPLPSSILEQVIAGMPVMSSGDKQDVLDSQ